MELVAAAIAKSIIGDYRDMFRRAGLKLMTAVPMKCAYAKGGFFFLLSFAAAVNRRQRKAAPDTIRFNKAALENFVFFMANTEFPRKAKKTLTLLLYRDSVILR